MTLNHFFAVGGLLIGLAVTARIMRRRHSPSASLAWLISIVVLPYIAIPFYVLFGGRKLRKHAMKKRVLFAGAARPFDGVMLDPSGIAKGLLEASGMPPPSRGNSFVLLENDGRVWSELCSRIEGAQKSIAVEVFILGCDPVGRRLVELLAERARDGVKVRLLLDALGSLPTRGDFVDPLREAGGEVGIFLPLTPFSRRTWSVNLRNHRKIFIIDDEAAFVGGINLGVEYFGPDDDDSRWLDLATVVEGPVVADLVRIFREDWEFATEERIEDPIAEATPSNTGNALLQVAASGPDAAGDVFYDALLAAISRATSRIHIVTPYFIPDEALVKFLSLQLSLGCDVALVLPEKSNHFLADLARAHALRELEARGAKIYLLPDRMLHAKLVLIDDDVGIVGSANLDIRSLLLNYEVSLFVYSEPELRAMDEWVAGLIARCHSENLPTPGRFRRFAEDVSYFVSPLL